MRARRALCPPAGARPEQRGRRLAARPPRGGAGPDGSRVRPVGSRRWRALAGERAVSGVRHGDDKKSQRGRDAAGALRF